MTNIQNVTRLEDLFPQYRQLDREMRSRFIPQEEDKFFGNPIKESFVRFFDSLTFTKIKDKKSQNVILSLYRANIQSHAANIRFYTLFVYEHNAELIPIGSQKRLRQLIPYRWVAFQAGESLAELEEFNQYRSIFEKKNVTDPIISSLPSQQFEPPSSPTLLNDNVKLYKTTDDGMVYHNLTHSIEIFLISQRDMTVNETTILTCLNTFTSIVKFLNG